MPLSMCLATVEKEHCCDQVTFRTAISKKYHNSDGRFSHQKKEFLPLVLNKIKITTAWTPAHLCAVRGKISIFKKLIWGRG